MTNRAASRTGRYRTIAHRQPSVDATDTAYTGPSTDEKSQTPDIPARTSWRYLAGSPRLIAPMPTVASAPAASARTAVPAMKTPMFWAVAHSAAPATVTIVKSTISRPTV